MDNYSYDIKIIKQHDNAWHVSITCWIGRWREIKFGASSLQEALRQVEVHIEEWLK